MPSRTRRSRGRAIRPNAVESIFLSAQFVRENLNPTRGRAGLSEMLQRLNYPTTDGDEPALASTLASPTLQVKAVRRIA
jgi:hypothetical protein